MNWNSIELKDYLWVIGLSIGAALLILGISDIEVLRALSCYLCAVLIGLLYARFKAGEDPWL